MLIAGPRHRQAVLDEYETHYSRNRPHGPRTVATRQRYIVIRSVSDLPRGEYDHRRRKSLLD